jgi:hypothetical protein
MYGTLTDADMKPVGIAEKCRAVLRKEKNEGLISMKYIYFYIFVILLLPVTVFAEVIDIGKTKVQYNIPEGYIEANKETDILAIQASAGHLPKNLTLYRVYKSKALNVDDYIALVFPANVDLDFQKEFFVKYIQNIKNSITKRMVEESARKVEKVFELNIEPNEPIIINDEEELVSVMTNVSYSADTPDKYNLSMIMSFIYCKNKLLAVYQYKSVHNKQDILKFVAIYKEVINAFRFR